MIISKTCNYAIRALLLVASEEKPFVSASEIADRLQAPSPFLAKVMHALVSKGLLTSTRGPRGGVSLLKPPQSTSLLDIVEAMDGTGLAQNCFIGMRTCDGSGKCPLHCECNVIRKGLIALLTKMTLDKLLKSGAPSVDALFTAALSGTIHGA